VIVSAIGGQHDNKDGDDVDNSNMFCDGRHVQPPVKNYTQILTCIKKPQLFWGLAVLLAVLINHLLLDVIAYLLG
jgi:hypothetical protein